MPLYAGVCETNITPPLGVWMSGYAFRPSGCVGVHDELHARAAVFDDGHDAVAIVGMDLIGLDLDLVERVRGEAAALTGMAPEAILLNASHTHGGPSVRAYHSMGARDAAYTEVMVRKLVGIIKQAWDNLQPASLAYGRAPVQIGVNRRQTRNTGGNTVLGRNYAGPVAPYVDVLVVADPAGHPFALLFCHACHGTTLTGENLRITADFAGYACEAVRRETDGAVVPLFLQGCCGNINPLKRSSFSAAIQNGRTLGAAAVAAMRAATPLYDDPIAHAVDEVMLPLLPPPPVEECEERMRHWDEEAKAARERGDVGHAMHAEGMRDYAEYERDIAARDETDLRHPFTLQCLEVGGARFLAMPAETVVQYALDFDRQTDGPVFPMGYTNGILNYLPTAADHGIGGYEVTEAYRYYGLLMFAPESERIVRGAAYRLLGVGEPDLTPYSL